MTNLDRAIVAGAIVLLVFGALLTSGINRIDNENAQGKILRDIGDGKTTGSLTGHFMPSCFTPSDAYNYRYGGSGIDDPNANDRVANKLLQENRCVIGPDPIKYDMTADGKVIFLTPDGSIELWPVPKAD